MRAKNMVLFVIAIGCGLVASIGVSQYMEHAAGSGPGRLETAEIFVAVTDINIGEALDARNVRLESWPRDRVPEGAISDLTELEEKYPRTRLYSGEPILAAKLMDSTDRNNTAITIPKGYRVVSVKVTVDTAVAGLIEPGDRVDLLLFLRKSSEVPQTGTRTILRDVNIFSVDGKTERSVDADGQARNLRTVSLLVTPKQSESVLLASELGTLFLTLRRPDDTTENLSDGETIQSLLGTVPESANEKSRRNSLTHPVGLNGWLDRQVATQDGTAPVRAGIGDVDEAAWKMRILSPTGYREFRWEDAQELPTEVTSDAGQEATSTADQDPSAVSPASPALTAPAVPAARAVPTAPAAEQDAEPAVPEYADGIGAFGKDEPVAN